MSNNTTGESEVLRVRIREAEKTHREKADRLSKAEARLVKIRGNRRKPARGSGKSQSLPCQQLSNLLIILYPALEDEVQEIVTKLQAEVQEDVLTLETMEIELQGLQGDVKPFSTRPLQT